MKRQTYTKLKALIILSVFSINIYGQGGLQLRKCISQLESAKTMDELLSSEQNFLVLVNEGKKLHHAYYYVSLNNLYLAFLDTMRTDDYCARADKYLHKLDSISPNNSEVYVLFAMCATAKITVDKAKRALKFGSIANKYSDRAILINQNNPRAYLTKARTVMITPPKLGGGPKFALKHYQKAVEKYKTFEPLDDLEPNWGEALAKKELEECQNKLKKK
ncbi:MAG TPA: hypothetical protein VN026_08805 [Bacteroidia bacterium]|jgi:hypothetical protein|nr:hypothetical protein [Bacteroidia bacterium]